MPQPAGSTNVTTGRVNKQHNLQAGGEKQYSAGLHCKKVYLTNLDGVSNHVRRKIKKS
jgi:hypothetical protein